MKRIFLTLACFGLAFSLFACDDRPMERVEFKPSSIASGMRHNMYLDNEGALFVMGINDRGVLGMDESDTVTN